MSTKTFEAILCFPGDPFQFMQGLGGSGATSLATSPSGVKIMFPHFINHHVFNYQARSLGFLVVKLAVPVKPKGDNPDHFHSSQIFFTSLFQGFVCCEASQE